MAKKKKGAKKGARKGAKKAKKTAKKGGAKRKPNAAFMKPMQPDAALGAVVGNTPIPRTEVTKKLWAYIKRNGLQDAKERRMINADDKLRVVFGGKGKVSMFEMTKLVSKHMK
jgi:upstream activation factor subunit UAF30